MKHGYSAPLAFLITILCLIWSSTSFAGQNANAVAHLYWQLGTGPGLASRTSTDGQPQLVVTVRNLKSFCGAEIQLLAYSNDGTPLPGAWLGDGTGGCNDGNFQYKLGGFGGTYPSAFTGVPGIAIGQNQEYFQTPDCLGPTGIGLFWFTAAGAAGIVRDSTTEYGLWSIKFDTRGTALGGNADCPGDLGDAGGPKPISIAALYRYPCSVGMKGFVIAITDINNQVDYVPVDPTTQTLGWEAAPVNPDITPPTVTVTSPNGGENLALGVPTLITTTASDNVAVSRMDVALSLDGGQTYPTAIATDVPYTSAFSWTPSVVNAHARIRVTVRDASGLPASDASNANFAISDILQQMVRVVYPNGGEVLQAGMPVRLQLAAANGSGLAAMNLYWSFASGVSDFQSIVLEVPYRDTLTTIVPSHPSQTVRLLVGVRDAAGVASSDLSDADFQIVTGADVTPPSATLTAPNGGEVWKSGETHNITWTASDNIAVSSVDLAYSTDGGVTYSNAIANGIANTGSFAWTVPSKATATARVRVTAHDAAGNSTSDASDGNFTILDTADHTPPTIEVVYPNGGEVLHAGQAVLLKLNGTDNIGITAMNLYWSYASGVSDFQTIVTEVPYRDTLTTVVPAHPSQTARLLVGVRDAAGNAASDPSDADFRIIVDADTVPPAATLTSPNGGESWKSGELHTIAWTASDNIAVSSLDLTYSTDGGATYPNAIATGLSNSGSHTWTVPAVATTTARVRVTAHDAIGNVGVDASDANFTILNVKDTTPPVVNVVFPNGGETFHTGQAVTIKLNGSDDVGITAMNLYWSYASGLSDFATIVVGVPFQDTLTTIIPNRVSSTMRLQVGVRDAAGNAASDLSEADFRVVSIADSIAPNITVTSPNGGELWTSGETRPITWYATDNLGVSTVDLLYSTDGGATYPNTIATELPNTGTYSWSVPGTATPTARVRAIARDAVGNLSADASDGNFEILSSVRVVYPNGGEVLQWGKAVTIQLSHTMGASLVAMNLYWSLTGGLSDSYPIVTEVPYRDTLTTIVPKLASLHARLLVGVRDVNGIAGSDMSDADFQLTSGTSTPVAMTGLNGSVLDGRVSLTWDLTRPAEVREVQVERREAGQGPYQLLAGQLAAKNHMDYSDGTARPTTSYEYRVTALGTGGGNAAMFFRITTPAAAFRVYAVAPNPFREAATIHYSVTQRGRATMEVLDVRGSIVRRLVDGSLEAGAHEVAWDGLTASGTPASAGIYFVRLSSAGRSTVRRVVRLR